MSLKKSPLKYVLNTQKIKQMIPTPSFLNNLTSSKTNDNTVIGLIALALLGFAFYHWNKPKPIPGPVPKPKTMTGPPTIETIQNLKK